MILQTPNVAPDRFAMDSILILISYTAEAQCGPRQICNGFCIDLNRQVILERPSVATDRFAMDSVFIVLRKLYWRALGSDGQICNRFCIVFITKMILEKLKL